jgi:hypothetical protein
MRPDRAVSRIAAACAAAVLLTAPAARADVLVEDGSNEAQIMGYYAAAIAFTPVGAAPGRFFVAGLDLDYVPGLSADDRTTTFAGSRVENTNFTSVLPRPHLRWRPADRWLFEAGFIPPLHAFGIVPGMGAAAVTARFAGCEDGVAWRARGHYLQGDIEGPITCSDEAVADPANTLCYGGEPSDDHFLPKAYGVDFIAGGPRLGVDGLAWYALAGYRHETLRFQTRFVNVFGRLDDQRLVARLDRGSVAFGLTWSGWRGLRVSGEGYYAPDALATVRVGVSWGWGGAR